MEPPEGIEPLSTALPKQRAAVITTEAITLTLTAPTNNTFFLFVIR